MLESQIYLTRLRAAQPHLNAEELGSFVILIPSSEEQTDIADFLDRETRRLDTLITKKQALIGLLKEKHTALISQAVTSGLPPDAAREFGLAPHRRFKESGIEWLGKIPEGWDAMPLRRVVKAVKTGGTPTGADEQFFEIDGFDWFTPVDFSDEVYLGESSRKLSDLGRKEVKLFPPQTIMMVGIGATIGKVALAKQESSCNQQINGIVSGDKLHPTFATYYLKTMRDFIYKCGKFTTMPIINQDETKT